ncbi:unnamed protein product [Protopolystoma xenopodis]|uniref:Uncharacterized protein n=1 Tax=Protopolystoma xenopodis TaxID=117903 RepID=A0A3S5CQL4_9PLAT|nr:unnamed protein product [Protopolystoma xenopodis]
MKILSKSSLSLALPTNRYFSPTPLQITLTRLYLALLYLCLALTPTLALNDVFSIGPDSVSCWRSGRKQANHTKTSYRGCLRQILLTFALAYCFLTLSEAYFREFRTSNNSFD